MQPNGELIEEPPFRLPSCYAMNAGDNQRSRRPPAVGLLGITSHGGGEGLIGKSHHTKDIDAAPLSYCRQVSRISESAGTIKHEWERVPNWNFATSSCERFHQLAGTGIGD